MISLGLILDLMNLQALKSYIDGVLNKTVTGSVRSNFYNNVYSFIGKDGRDNNDKFVGQISKILIYNTGLTDAQVNQNFTGQDNLTFTIDVSGPKVTSITTSTANGVYTDDDNNPSNSDTVTFTVNFDELTTITGTPRLPLITSLMLMAIRSMLLMSRVRALHQLLLSIRYRTGISQEDYRLLLQGH